MKGEDDRVTYPGLEGETLWPVKVRRGKRIEAMSRDRAICVVAYGWSQSTLPLQSHTFSLGYGSAEFNGLLHYPQPFSFL